MNSETGLGGMGERGQYMEGNSLGSRNVFGFHCLFLNKISKLTKFRIKRKTVTCPMNKGE